MKDLEIGKKTDVEIVILGENVAPTTIRLSLGDIIMRMEELIDINKNYLIRYCCGRLNVKKICN